MVKEPVVFVAGHAVVEEILVHTVAQVVAVRQVESKEALLIEAPRVIFTVRPVRVKVLRGFALDEDGVRPLFEDGVHGEQIRLAQVLERRHECVIRLQPFVPPSELRGERGRDEDLIHGRVEPHPWESPGEREGVLGEQLGQSGF